jgi:hypothetical protein
MPGPNAYIGSQTMIGPLCSPECSQYGGKAQCSFQSGSITAAVAVCVMETRILLTVEPLITDTAGEFK